MPDQAAPYRRDEVPSTMSGGTSPTRDTSRPPRGRYRWVICALLFFATTINYVDRGVLGVLAPSLQEEIGWTDTQYGDINAAFSLAYAIGFLVLGRFIDRVGTRAGYAIALVAWSLAAAGHALASSAFGFGVARFLLGLGEAGNFPAAVKVAIHQCRSSPGTTPCARTGTLADGRAWFLLTTAADFHPRRAG
jgi:MFS family permease